MAFRVACRCSGPERAAAPAGGGAQGQHGEIRAEKNMEMAELKKLVADVLERVGVGGGLLSEHKAKKARDKDQDESNARHACD